MNPLEIHWQCPHLISNTKKTYGRLTMTVSADAKTTDAQTHVFEAEVTQLLDLVALGMLPKAEYDVEVANVSASSSVSASYKS